MSVRLRARTHLLMSAMFFSTAGLFMGLIQTGVWAVVFWRSLFALVFVCVIILFARKRAFGGLDHAGLAAAMLSAAAMVAFIPALSLTSVANVAVMHGSLPLVTALLGRLVLGERISLVTAGLCGAVGCGAGVIFSGSASSGLHLAGDGLALVMTVFMALMTIALRQSRSPSALLVALSNGLAALVAAAVAPSLEVSVGQVALLACFALVQMTLGLLFIVTGSRLLPPAETALISLAEVPLSALWVWLAFSQVPPARTLAGAGIILTAVLFFLAAPLRCGGRNSEE